MTSLRTGPLGGGVANGFPSTNQSVLTQTSRSGVKAVESDPERRAERRPEQAGIRASVFVPFEKLWMAD